MATPGAQAYEKWHWGIAPKKVFDWNDADVPEDLIECGRLVELHFREPGQRKDTVIKIPRVEANGSHLCFDPEHAYGRLYILPHPAFQEKMQKKYHEDDRYQGGSKYRSLPLVDLAAAVGGRHATNDYPDVDASPIGILTHVVYATEKKGDGYSFYIHKLGEETGVRPCLAVDAKGRLWICGGAYRGNPTAGVTD